MTFTWHAWPPGAAARQHAARAALTDTLAVWRRMADTEPTRPASFGLTAPSHWWPELMTVVAAAGKPLGHFSEVAREPNLSAERLAERAVPAGGAIDGIAVAVLLHLDPFVDDDLLLSEAAGFVEVIDGDTGLEHAAEAIAGLLQITLLCGEEQIPVPQIELIDASVRILAPLLAQRACLATILPAPQRTIRLTISAADLARVDAFCRDRVAAQDPERLRVERTVCGETITILERRAPWRHETQGEWTSTPIGQLRYSPAQQRWTLHWCDRRGRWHLYSDSSGDLAALLTTIDDDAIGIFWS